MILGPDLNQTVSLQGALVPSPIHSHPQHTPRKSKRLYKYSRESYKPVPPKLLPLAKLLLAEYL